jgi:hypothetical protein
MSEAVFLVETNTHEGYCSESECEYKSFEETVEVGSLDEIAIVKKGVEIVCETLVASDGSWQCSPGTHEQGIEMGQHSYRVTLLRHDFLTKSALFNQ